MKNLACIGVAIVWGGCLRQSLEPYVWGLPEQVPIPAVPENNPMSHAKVELGRHLFYDPRFSISGTTSCATCHQQALAFSDGLASAEGDTGEFTPKSALSLTNVGYNSRLMWAQPLVDELSKQALLPMLNEDPVEMGVTDALMTSILAEFKISELYAPMFESAILGFATS